MKKFGSKSIALLMSLIMVFSIFAPVAASAAEWTHDKHTHTTSGPINYVSIGDSMSNGYGLPGYDGWNGVFDYGYESYANQFAAYLAGVRNIIIPKKNEKDLNDIDPSVRENVNFIPCSNIFEVLSVAFSDEEIIAIINNVANLVKNENKH